MLGPLIVCGAATLVVGDGAPDIADPGCCVAPVKISAICLTNAAYRERLEELGPNNIALLLLYTDDPIAVDYLTRLLAYARNHDRNGSSGERDSITFITGTDQRADKRFYTAAEDYYSTSLQYTTHHIDVRQRSLLEIRNRLAVLPTSDGRPWGVVNIVTHSSEWSGMALPVFRDGVRVDPISLEDAVEQNFIEPLPNAIVDSTTEIRVQGCGLGKKPELLHLLSVALGGDDSQRPIVRSSKNHTVFESTRLGSNVIGAEKYFVEAWWRAFPSKHVPKDRDLVRRFRRKYPLVDIDWNSLFVSNRENLPDDWEIEILPIKVRLEGVRQDLDLFRSVKDYVSHQGEMKEYVRMLGLSLSDFDWTLDSDRSRSSSTPITGLTHIVTVQRELRAINENGIAERWTPPLDDPLHFGIEIPDKRPEAQPGYKVMPY